MNKDAPAIADTKLLKIKNQKGLHARASAKFVRLASEFDAHIMVSRDGHVVGGTSIMGLMMLAASKGCDIHISATGPQSAQAIAAIEQLIENKFDEED